ncbi:hypothetical protein H5P28_13555 [Ruficoccus amylovorans]|uniref:Tetratricopeptide repeat protein n=1 Tax=Ruficoccus amylovorans TaxID=1804625 RepID=A0A842HG77_9BACT|nr:hypothetical protein [Ruficoccus amylovorans]MBC2595289.1 hypothetical protein [Ruficoccus amylovorans]
MMKSGEGNISGRGLRGAQSASVWVLLGLGVFLGGCASYQDETRALQQAWIAGDDVTAAAEARSQADDDPTGTDALLWRLEEGAAYRAGSEFNQSNTAFAQAEARVNYYDSQASFRVSEQTLATLTNLTFLPYEGTAYDRIMLNTYKALNYLSLGDYEAARVELNRALDRQREAVAANAAAIAEAEENADVASAKAGSPGEDGYNVHRALDDPSFQRQLSSAYSYLNRYSVYADYVNPFTVFLEGLYFMCNAASPSDLERSRMAFQRVSGMLPNNRYISQDLATLNDRLNGQPMPHLTYVIFETGMAPSRTEHMINIPLFLVTKQVPYVGVAFPQLRFNDYYVPSLTAHAGGSSYETMTVCDMDSVVAQDFQNYLPVAVTRTLISAGVKAALQYGVYEATKDNSTVNLIAMIGTSIYAASTNHADLRTWVTLPKEFSYCRFHTPESRQVEIRLRGAQRLTVDLLDGQVNVIYIKSNSPGASVSVQQFVMKESDYPMPDQGALSL